MTEPGTTLPEGLDRPAASDEPMARGATGWAGRRAWLTSLLHTPTALVSTIFLATLVLASIASIWLVPEADREPDLLTRWREPLTSGHVLGTDGLGRDMVAQLLVGARLTLVIGVGVVLVAGAVGTLLGLIAGYKGGRLETVIMRLADAQLAFPGLLVVLLVLAFVGASIPVIIGILAIYGWMIFARIVRGQVLQLRETPAVRSAQLVGCSTPRILVRHLLPSIYPLLLTQAMLEFARVILAEASLSYLGLGVQAPLTSWGLLVAENQAYIATAWWTVVLPGAALVCTVLSLNLVSHWLSAQIDPQQRQQRYALRMHKQRPPELTVDITPVARRQGAPVSLLSVEGLRVDFHMPEGRVTAVDGASLEIAAGETVGIVGESGSGKSTLALALMDLVPLPGRVERAAIRWEGEPIDRRALRGLRGSDMTMIFQDPMTSLNPLVPVGRQITESLIKHKGMTDAQAQARAHELLEFVGIASPRERMRQFPYELSGGMRQRVMIAVAIAPEPKLVIADEPTTALDATIQAQILELIADLQSRLGIAMLLITHDLGVIAGVCDRVIVMYGGRQVEQAPAARLFGGPRHPYTEALLRAAPSIDVTGRRLTAIPGAPPRGAARHPGCPFAARCAGATERCTEMPPTTTQGDGHTFACWHPCERERATADAGALGGGR